VKKTLGYHERRSVLQQAAALLSEEADNRDFRPAYARMNPGAKLRHNSFEFRRVAGPARAVILGPWLYVRAPGMNLPRAFQKITEEMRREKHLGALEGRLRLTNSGSLAAVREIIDAFKRDE
jgi:hypothetical protein